jgi:NADH-quinone oxidoreductase subunit M
MPVVIGASWNDRSTGRRSMRAFFAWLLVLEALMIGVFAATDVFLFYVFFEAMLVPMYFLIGSFGGPRRQYAAVKFFLYSLVGGLIMLAAVIGLYVVSTQQGGGTFAFDALRQLDITPGVQRLLFLGFFIAFAIKAPLVPLHTWLPDSGAEAPIGGAVLLVGVLDKVGTFGFIRYCLPLFPRAAHDFAPWVLGLAVAGILYAALLAMGQSDMKRLVSYTSISHFGFIALGIFAFTTEAGTGAVLYMVNHGISTGLLFVVVGMLISRGGSRQIGDYGGVARFAPLLAGSLLIAGLASLALPGTNSFVSEFLTLIGSFPTRPVYTIIATTGMILAALYILLMYQRTMNGPPRGVLLETGSGNAVPADGSVPAGDPAHGHGGGATATLTAPAPAPSARLRIRDLDRRELAVVTPLIALIIALGVYPQPLIDLIRPAVAATMTDIGADPGGITPHTTDAAPTFERGN